MQAAEVKQHVPRDHEFRLPVAACGVGGERVVARHVCMNDVDLVTRDETCEFMRARHVERIAHRQRLDTLPIEFQVSDERRVWPHHGEELVTARDQRIREIGNIPLAAAERCR